ncbi:MAG TPA: DNA-binding response regulator [Firmicutes bacterium]|jgi:two-component system, OmpR family, response regulator ArlR|nr:DNA-binding response regulator [Bacillota bacterium]
MDSTKLLIIEDEKQIARFLELELTHEGYKVEIESDGREGLEKVKENHYDIILLDIMIPGINGMEVCRRIRQFSNIPIVMLTAKDEIMSKVMGLDLGADDYITKPFSIEELLARLRVVLRHQTKMRFVKELQIGDLVMDVTSHQISRKGKNIELTKKEYDLLEYLLQNQGMVLTREQILVKVWGYDYYGGTNIVDVYINYLRNKVDDPFEDKLIHTIRGVGYILKGNEP